MSTSVPSLPVLTGICPGGWGMFAPALTPTHLNKETSSLSPNSPAPPTCWGEEQTSLLLQWPLWCLPCWLPWIPQVIPVNLDALFLRAGVPVLASWWGVCEFSPVVQPIVSLLDTWPKHAAFQVGPAWPPPGHPPGPETMARTAPTGTVLQPPVWPGPFFCRACASLLLKGTKFCAAAGASAIFLHWWPFSPIPPLSAPLAGLHSPFRSDLKCCLIGEADPNARQGFVIPC